MKKKRMIMKILKKGGGVVEKRGEEETKSIPHAPVVSRNRYGLEKTVDTHKILINAIKFYVCPQEI